MNASEKEMITFRTKQASRYTLPIVVILIGIVLSLIAFIIVQDWEHERIRTEFEQDAEDRYEALKREIESNLDVLGSIKAFYTQGHKIEQSEFRDFVNPFLERHPSIQTLEWILRVSNSQREAYEKAVKREGFRGFQITDRETQGRMIRAPQRKEYFPVYFVEPYKGNERALGFDLGSDQACLAALERSRDTGEMVATARIKLLQETIGQFGFLVFAPIYRKGALTNSVESRRENLEGFALGVFRIGDILEKSLTYLNPEGISIYLYDKSAPEQGCFLYYHPSDTTNLPLSEKEANSGIRYAKTFNLGGRKWLILCTPTPDYIVTRKTWQPWGVLLIGLLFTAFLGSYLLINTNRAERIERVVKERTDELRKTNEALSREIAVRMQVEKELQKTHDKLEIRVKERTSELLNVNEKTPA